ncbi:MAG: host attachment protein [Deltaproteobacteria bacterium]|nr:host attachment protein [Deltaproteobacteria bacterium]
MGSAPFQTRAALPEKRSRRWVLVMNREVANVFEQERSGGDLRLQISLANPEGRLKNSELVSGPNGSSKRESGPGSDAYSTQHSPKERVLESFTRDVVKMLDDGLDRALWTELSIIAESQTLGMVRRAISKRVRERVVLELSKDIVTLDGNGLRLYLNEAARRMRGGEESGSRVSGPR